MGPASNLQNAVGYLPPGTPSAPVGYGTGTTADLDGDGLLEMIVFGFGGPQYNTPGLGVLPGLPDGGLGPPTFYPLLPAGAGNGPDRFEPVVAADANGDGLPDVLFAFESSIQIATNIGGKLQSRAPPIQTSDVVTALAVGDLNEDGIADIVDGEQRGGASFDDIINIFEGIGDGGFSAAAQVASIPGSMPWLWTSTLFLSDLDLDGFPDIVASPALSTGEQLATPSEIAVLLHEADGGYRTTLYEFPDQVVAMALPRKERAPDLIAVYDHSTPTGKDGQAVVQILSNAGDGTFSIGPAYLAPNLVWDLAIGDFNGDCIPDLVGSSWGVIPGDGIAILYGEPDGGFEAAQSLPIDGCLPGPLGLLGPTSSPRALVSISESTSAYGLVVYGDASSH